MIAMPCVEFHKMIGNKVKLDSIILILLGGSTDKPEYSVWPFVLLGFDLNPCHNKVAGRCVASRKGFASPVNGEKAIGRDRLCVCAFGANAKIRCGRTLALAHADELDSTGVLGMNPLNLAEMASRDCKSAEA